MLCDQILKEQFKHDNFFENNEKIIIIDNYNIINIKEQEIQFFYENFKDVGCKNIDIYFQVQAINVDNDKIIELSNEFGVTFNDMLSLISFLKIRSNCQLENEIVNKKKSLKHAIDFIEEMKKINIDVTLRPYLLRNNEKYFHGRYWISKNSNNEGIGYIIDGSLNTIEKAHVLGQLMDNQNYNLIVTFFNETISRGLQQYNPLDLETLNKYYYLINRLCR